MYVISFRLNSTYGVESIVHIFKVFFKAQLFRALRNRGVITWRTRDFFCSRWTSPSINLIVLLVLGWPFYNSKSFKPNGSASLFGRKNRKNFSYLWALVRATYFAIAMGGTCACQSFWQNPPPAGKDELAEAASGAFTNDGGTFSHTSVVSSVPTPAPATPLASAELVAKYINADLQKATKLALEVFVQSQ